MLLELGLILEVLDIGSDVSLFFQLGAVVFSDHCFSALGKITFLLRLGEFITFLLVDLVPAQTRLNRQEEKQTR